jgi:uncharacterized coiled-coil DUF342 family protein
MTQGELSKVIKAKEKKIRQQRERIDLLNNAIDEFQKQCDKIIELVRETKTEQKQFNQSVPDDDL